MNSQNPPCDLAGLSVLVTRPAHQSEPLCDLIAAAHGRPIRFPALEIRGPTDKLAARRELEGARRADLLLFVSANAVRYAFPLLPDQLPLDVAIGAVGRATAQALAEDGLLDILSSDYVPSSLLHAAFMLADRVEAVTLPDAIATVTANPAQSVGLTDRGEIAVGKRADFIRVRDVGGTPVVRSVWREGARVL